MCSRAADTWPAAWRRRMVTTRRAARDRRAWRPQLLSAFVSKESRCPSACMPLFRRLSAVPRCSRLPRRYFATPLLATDELAFDTGHGLFADPRMRQAVNYALDRPALAAALGDLAAASYLPPGLPGSRVRHVYPLSGPDLERARALAGPHGGHAVLAVCSDPGCTEARPYHPGRPGAHRNTHTAAAIRGGHRIVNDQERGPASSSPGPPLPTPTRPPSSQPPSAADSPRTAWPNSRASTAISGSAPRASSSSS